MCADTASEVDTAQGLTGFAMLLNLPAGHACESRAKVFTDRRGGDRGRGRGA